MLLILDVGVDEERVCLRVNVLHHDLEAVEASSFRDLNFTAEPLDEVLIDDSIRRGKEGQHVRDEESLVVSETVVPVVQVFGKINLFSGPEGCFGFLIHLPDLVRESMLVVFVA